MRHNVLNLCQGLLKQTGSYWRTNREARFDYFCLFGTKRVRFVMCPSLFHLAQKGSRAGGGGRYEIEMSINPTQKAHAAPRCHAKSKRTGKPCRAPAVRGWKVCRMHGARGGAPEGKRNGNYRHGVRCKETIALWKLIKSLR